MTAPEPRPAHVKFTADVRLLDTFFYTYDAPDAGAPVIAGVRFGGGSDVTVYTRAQAQEIADAFLSLVAQFAELEAREGEAW